MKNLKAALNSAVEIKKVNKNLNYFDYEGDETLIADLEGVSPAANNWAPVTREAAINDFADETFEGTYFYVFEGRDGEVYEFHVDPKNKVINYN